MSSWLNDVGEIRQNDKGKFYIKMKKDVTLAQGQNVVLTSFEDHIEGLFKNGLIDEEKKQQRLQLSFLKYILNVPPLG